MNSLVETTRSVLGDRDAAQEQRLLRIKWREPDGRLAVLDGLAVAAREGKAAAELGARRRRIGIELNRSAESRNCFLRTALHHGPIAERDVRPGIPAIKR